MSSWHFYECERNFMNFQIVLLYVLSHAKTLMTHTYAIVPYKKVYSDEKIRAFISKCTNCI